jgi:hypothetical protein
MCSDQLAQDGRPCSIGAGHILFVQPFRNRDPASSTARVCETSSEHGPQLRIGQLEWIVAPARQNGMTVESQH